ncbi:hypothetical protein [Ligilactobacillus animalis]|nr:hypothetical protein [Ligilactobacillus animalis]
MADADSVHAVYERDRICQEGRRQMTALTIIIAGAALAIGGYALSQNFF